MSGATPGEIRRALPKPVLPLLDAVIEVADEQGIPVYLVGGPVRDWLLGCTVRDVDLLVESESLSGAGSLADAAAPSGAQVVRHDRFATAAIQHGGVGIEMATARREIYPHDGGLPSIEPASLEEDLLRRDFSVNALAVPLSRAARERRPGIVSVEDGLRDIEERVLRVLQPKSLCDDPTRALRAARLAPRLGLSVSRGTRKALRDALRAGAFGRVSGDRLRRELVRIFDDAVLGLDPSRSLRLLSDWHVLGALEPGLHLPRESVLPLRRFGRAIAEPPWRLGRARPWVSGLCLSLAPLKPGLRRRTLRRFAVRGEAERRIVSSATHRDARLKSLSEARGRGAVDALLGELAGEELNALYAWAEPAGRRRIFRYCTQDQGRRLPISGQDLVELGLDGLEVGRALKRVRAAFLDGAVKNRDEALALAREVGRRRAGSSRRRSKAPRSPL